MMLLWRTPVLLLLLLCLASQRSEGARAQRKRKKSNRLETRDMDCSWNCSQQGLPCRVKKECGWWCNAYNNTHCPETPAKPVLHGRGAEPFVFQSGDGESAKYHLGLNVTWEPPDDGSIVFVRGFQVHVMSMNAKDIGWTDCVTLNITGAKLSMADPKRVFYFNCFESEPGIPKRFLPGEKYHIVLYSKPEQGPRHMDQNVSVDITMPDCNARGMEDVEECKGTCTPEDGARPDGSSAVAINNVRPGDVDDDDSSSTVALLQDRPPATNFSVMPVLLIYSHDHRLHEATVRAFAAFLRQQCGCDVTLDDYCMESIARRGKIPWLCQQIKKAKRVILVCSEGTKRIWKDIENAEPLHQPPHPLPCGDMVRPAIYLVTAEFYKSSTFDKYITAYFSYSSEQDVPSALNVGNNYMLMKHFEELYFHLLRWTHRPARPDITMPELGEDQYHLSEAGGELKRCIDEMTAFQAAHPTWFQDSQGSSQACGGGEDTGVQPHNGTPSDVLDITGRHDNHRFGGLYYGSQPDGQCRNDHDYDYDPSPESLVSSFNVSMTNELGMQVNGHFRGQPMIDQSMAGMRRDFSDLDAVCTVPPPPVRNSVDTRMVVPNGGVMEGHANRRASPARAVGHQTIQSGDTSDYSVIPNLATPNPFISPSVALLARHVQQAQATQGGQASEDEGLGTLNVSRTTDV
uniref:SEFIR domain-containing protein n=1 Tax=Branchiostoma floridae TaxID=7739 RepID=C3Z2Q8_BRAFL|eukprot:XP_002597297.1 hypothetical protein BRAFLDRAFT_66438 [Branchiostoma floridae]